MAARIVVVGSFNTDLVSYVQRMPRPGETVHGDTFMTGAGGKGSNQAVAAARLGAEVTFIGRLGKDVFANLAYEIWDAEGINSDYVVQDEESATGVAPIFVDSAGENMIVVVLGANSRVQSSDIDAARERIAAADVLVAQLEINTDMVTYALQVAKEVGITTILNPAPAAPIARETDPIGRFPDAKRNGTREPQRRAGVRCGRGGTRADDARRSDRGGDDGRAGRADRLARSV